MDEALHQRVRDRAHQIWEEEGRPVGVAHLHWIRALDEIMAADGKGTSIDEPKASAPEGEHVYGGGDETLKQRTDDDSQR